MQPPRAARKSSAPAPLAPKPSPDFNRRLLAYALAGGAAAAPASAAVVYSGAQNLTVSWGNTQAIDFTGIGSVGDYTFDVNLGTGSITVSGAAGNFVAHQKLNADATPFASGSVIGSAAFFSLGTKTLAAYSGPGGWSGGSFAVGTSFLGVQLTNGSDNHYGWVRVTVPANTSSPLTIVDWAHESTANTEIRAGSTSVPETGSTALFSLGAAGLCLWRARKRAQRDQA